MKLVTFHLVSGERCQVEYSDQRWEQYWKNLEHDWNDAFAAGPYFGINFDHVTHYQVEDKE